MIPGPRGAEVSHMPSTLEFGFGEDTALLPEAHTVICGQPATYKTLQIRWTLSVHSLSSMASYKS